MTYDCECSECGKPFLSEYPNIEMCPTCAEEMILRRWDHIVSGESEEPHAPEPIRIFVGGEIPW